MSRLHQLKACKNEFKTFFSCHQNCEKIIFFIDNEFYEEKKLIQEFLFVLFFLLFKQIMMMGNEKTKVWSVYWKISTQEKLLHKWENRFASGARRRRKKYNQETEMFSDLHIPADPNQQIPTNPLKTWRTLFEGKNLDIKEIIQFFQICSPFFISIEQKDSTKLGESNLLFSSLIRCRFRT